MTSAARVAAEELDRELLVGVKVHLVSLIHEGTFPGEIIEVSPVWGGCSDKARPICTVKLEFQEDPVPGVIYYDQKPVEICSNLWQACWPLRKEDDSARDNSGIRNP